MLYPPYLRGVRGGQAPEQGDEVVRPGERGLVLVVLLVLGGNALLFLVLEKPKGTTNKQTIAYLQQDAEEGEQRLAHDGARRVELREERRDERRGVRQRLLFVWVWCGGAWVS